MIKTARLLQRAGILLTATCLALVLPADASWQSRFYQGPNFQLDPIPVPAATEMNIYPSILAGLQKLEAGFKAYVTALGTGPAISGWASILTPTYAFMPRDIDRMTWSLGTADNVNYWLCLSGPGDTGDFLGLSAAYRQLPANRAFLGSSCGASANNAAPAQYPARLALTYWLPPTTQIASGLTSFTGESTVAGKVTLSYATSTPVAGSSVAYGLTGQGAAATAILGQPGSYILSGLQKKQSYWFVLTLTTAAGQTIASNPITVYVK